MSGSDARPRSRSRDRERDRGRERDHNRSYEPELERHRQFAVDNRNQHPSLSNTEDPDFKLKCRLFLGSVSFEVHNHFIYSAS